MIIKGRWILMFAILSAQLVGLRPVHANVPSFQTLLETSESLIPQSAIGPNACGPTALLYAFKLGRKDMREAYDKLGGSGDSEKLRSIVQTYGARESQTKYHRVRLEAKNGMAPLDLFATASDMLSTAATKAAPLLQQTMARKESEAASGSFLARIHESLKRSIANKVPVVSIIVPYIGTYKPEKNMNLWSEHTGHYVVITGVPERLHPGALGFTFEYLDPATGRASQAMIFEEVERTYWARDEKGSGSSDWIYPEVTHNNKRVSSPFLVVTAPGLNLVPKGIKDSQRLVLAFTMAIGDFGGPFTAAP